MIYGISKNKKSSIYLNIKQFRQKKYPTKIIFRHTDVFINMSENPHNESVEEELERPSFKGCILCYTGEMANYLIKKLK